MMTQEQMERMTQAVLHIREKMAEAAIRAGRKPEEILLCAACKTRTVEEVRFSAGLPIDLFGENHVQELVEKTDAGAYLGKPGHFIGHLQTNKVAKVLPLVTMIQSVDSVKLAQQISKTAEKLGKDMDILLEVNIGDEDSKTGFSADELVDSAAEIASFPFVHIRGLMAIPPICDNSDMARRFFSSAHQLFVDIGSKNIDNIDMSVLSMGMSHDYYEAILEGATMVRVGSSLFGSRRY